MAIAGRVAIVPKGDYDMTGTTAYKRLDRVRYQNKSYVAKKDNSGILPTNTEYWMLDGDYNTQTMTTSTNGIGKPDGTTLEVDVNGTMSVKNYGTDALETTDQTLTGAINEVFNLFGSYISYNPANERISFHINS